uniref:BESS domain-containing protein n=1 Tax=Caenorhabditis tropicalis TaxID=1561998 RepID=A0A1I7U9A9_9PELO
MFIADQSMKSSYSDSGSSSSSDSQDRLNLQPPALKQKEETFDNHVTEKNFVYGADRPLSDIFYETGASDDDNEIDRNYSPVTTTTTENSYRNTDTTTRRHFESSTYPTSTITVTTRQEPRKYETELTRGEGNSDISMSGYGFESGSTSSPIMLEFLEKPRKYENASPNNTGTTDVTDFTREVDEFYKSSTSLPIQTFEYGAVRDVRDSLDKETTTPKFPFNREEEEVPTKSKWTSKRKIREKDDNSKCNNPILKDLMEMVIRFSNLLRNKKHVFSEDDFISFHIETNDIFGCN